ncbi:hypothetical protein MP228_007677 [Amoeboaphelidium protococcarum]|nr:hypothetical protein MP228_007677 [Amoeboaphelidium protococcarum]
MCQFGISERKYRDYKQQVKQNPTDTPENVKYSEVKKTQKAKYFEIEEQLVEYCSVIRSYGAPISGPQVQIRAHSLLSKLLADPNVPQDFKNRYADAKFSDTWLRGFKKRNGYRWVRINGERASIKEDYEALLQPILDDLERLQIPPERIYNWDETGLFYRQFGSYTMAGEGDDGAGAKVDKLRLTILFTTNADGSDRDVVIIGKSKCPQGTSADFWRELGVKYYSNSKAWMTRDIFTELVKDFDARLEQQSVLLLDNFSGHILSEEDMATLKNLILIFLPPGTTSKTQPLDAGIISTFKSRYIKSLQDFSYPLMLDQTFDKKMITVSRVVPWIVESYFAISQSTIAKCFHSTLKIPICEALLNAPEEPLTQSDGQESLSGMFIDVNDQQDITDLPIDEMDVENEAHQETIRIADPNTLLRGLTKYREYFAQTENTHGLEYIKAVEQCLINDLSHFEPQQ